MQQLKIILFCFFFLGCGDQEKGRKKIKAPESSNPSVEDQRDNLNCFSLNIESSGPGVSFGIRESIIVTSSEQGREQSIILNEVSCVDSEPCTKKNIEVLNANTVSCSGGKNMEVEMFFTGKWISTGTTISSPAICISSTGSSRTISFNSYDLRSKSDLYGKFSGQIRLERYCIE